MRKLLFGLFICAFAIACSNTPEGSNDYSIYPKEYQEFDLPAYPNIAHVGQSETSPLGDDGDIQMSIKFKTGDKLEQVKNFYDAELKKLGYNANPNTQLKDLMERGAPVNESNFFAGNYQNVGRVFNFTLMERQDSVNVSIIFMGS